MIIIMIMMILINNSNNEMSNEKWIMKMIMNNDK